MQAVTIEKLSGQANYGSWSFAMEMFLIDCDLWECIDENYMLDTVEAKKKDKKEKKES
jgi:hypothetical protein